ncbi:MAG: AMP-binding protein [Microthrixaceae bacterium]
MSGGALSAGTVADLLELRAGDAASGLVEVGSEDGGGGLWTWGEVVTAADRVGLWLVSVPGDGPFHVGVFMENTPAHLFTMLGAARVGAAVVGLNTTRRGAELARDVLHTDCRVVVTDVAGALVLGGADLRGVPVVVVEARTGLPVGATAAADDVPSAGTVARPVPEDLFMLLFTSGSTGAPKAVRMTHARAARMADGSRWFSGDDVLYGAMPLFHGNALNAIVLPALATGATIALRRRFSASEFIPDCGRTGATFFSTVGRALSYVLATPPTDTDRDHRVAYGLAPESSPADIRAFRERFGITCFTGYGSSENAIILTPVPGAPREALGRPQDGADVAVVDPDTGVECPRARFDADGRLVNAEEAIGEIVGRNLVDRFEGYYENPEADAERTRNGWYWSGDLGYVDEDGVFHFAGRTGDRLRVDSENFAAAPVERILGRFRPAVGVAVVAVPDERTADDQVMATIELAAGEDFDPEEFAAFLAAQPDLSAHWAPRYVRVGRLPVGATNKIDKRPLRADRWWTDDPVFWRPVRGEPYRRFTAEDLAALEERFATHGRDPRRP